MVIKVPLNSNARHLDPKKISFRVFSADEIRKLSVLKINTPLSFNVLGHPLTGGLYDRRLGPLSDREEACDSCSLPILKCPGHFGHIELPVPVVNPLFHKIILTLLKLSCLNCFTLQVPVHAKLLLMGKIKLLEEGFYTNLEDLDQEVSSAISSTNNGSMQEADVLLIRDIIEGFIQNAHNRERHRLESLAVNESELNTKTIILQKNSYIESFLRDYKPGKTCSYCHEHIIKINTLKNRLMINKVHLNRSIDQNQSIVPKAELVPLMPDQIKDYLRKLWNNEKEVLKVITPCLDVDVEFPTDLFFYEVVPVLPPLVRPANFLDGQIVEHPQTQAYKSIIQDCLILKNIIQAIQDGDTNQLPDEGKRVYNQIRGNTPLEKLHNAWQALQADIEHLMDRDLSKTTESANCLGLKQVIEKKEGIIRMHMMGKRVNFAARSVITPDPNLNIDEVGIPEAFATKLTYPVPVTPYNVTELRQLILNGPEVHPGAVLIEGEDGVIKRLPAENYSFRQSIAKRLLTSSDKANKFFHGIKIVHRHLQNGDILLLNRQPTLHKPSIMAHKARILKGEKTLRLHYANCKAYNADFDGDEMNASFPQNELARAEGYYIANVNNQYLVPKDGTPLSGLIQDHMIAGVKLSVRGKFFTKEDYMQLVFAGLSIVKGDLIILPPTILKPVQLWSGKQIISTIIINILPRNKPKINLTASSKIGFKDWQVQNPRIWKCGFEFKDPKVMSEAEVIIRNGELHSGVLDKKHYGSTPFGLVHCVYELYGGEYSSKLLSAFGKTFQAFLQREGFTLGVSDILVNFGADQKRDEIIKKCREIGEGIQRSVLELPEDTPYEEVQIKIEEAYRSNPKFRTLIDRKYKTALDIYTNEINKTCLPNGLIKKFPENNLQLMVQSGAKGSTVNTMQISCLLGQIELEGKRPPLMISGKSLPSFKPYDPSPRAGGFIDGRFMTGIQPQEFFFHCMAGREGLIDTAVKTSRSGYLQRCLIKHMEGLSIGYDLSVRDSDGSLIQIYYGEDGLDILNSQFLNEEQIKFLVENKEAIVDKNTVKELKENSNYLTTQKLIKKINKWKKKKGNPLEKRRMSGFSKYSEENRIEKSSKNNIVTSCGRTKASISVMKKWVKLDEEGKNNYNEQCNKCPDPVVSKYRQDLEFGILTERLESLIDKYVEKKITNIGKDELRDIVCSKVMKTICSPGEAVGLLAAQSIGEPSTQMTLNTFHFSGRGDMNITLGIPRLREILMMASKNIKTPSMEIPFKKNIPNLNKIANKIRIKLAKCYVSNVIKDVEVSRKLELNPRRLRYSMKIQFLPHKSYKNEFSINPKDIISTVEKQFFKQIFRDIKKISKATNLIYFEEDKQKNKDDIIDEEEIDLDETKGIHNKMDLGEMHESSDEEEVAEDADATVSRTVSRHQENQEYEDPEDEEIDDADENEEENGIDNRENEENFNQSIFDNENGHSINQLIYEDRKKDVISLYSNAIDYDYDFTKNLWCKLDFWLPLNMVNLDLTSIIKNAANNVILCEVPNIKRAFTYQNQNGELILKTDGINIVDMFKYDNYLDLHKLYSNDIYNISQTYGIEAANRTVIKEVKDVFKVYGITVDTRHLSLVADYMTFDGEFKPMSRKGMEASASPFQQMSFESSINFLKSATLQGKHDYLVSPSSCLMVGQPCKIGTGSFDVLVDIQKLLTQNLTQPQLVTAGT